MHQNSVHGASDGPRGPRSYTVYSENRMLSSFTAETGCSELYLRIR